MSTTILSKRKGFQIGHGLMGKNPTSKGKRWKLSDETKEKMRISKLGNKNPRYAKKMLSQTKEAIYKAIKGNKFNLGRIQSIDTRKKISNRTKGENHPLWIKDRSLLKKTDRRNDSAYKEWRINVYKRDLFKCKIDNKDCTKTKEAHHILEWKDYPELRYNVDNGITLCKYHHPKIRSDVKKMAETFKKLIK